MANRVVLYPYKMASKASKELADALGVRRVYKDRKYVGKQGHVIINFGANAAPDKAPEGGPATFINLPSNCRAATNKLKAYQIMGAAGVLVPDFTTNRAEAETWIGEGSKVICRTILNGHGGGGIVLAEVVEELVEAPLYTRYVKKKHEYRIHVTRNGVFDYVQKKVREGSTGNDFQIRNYENGWVFTRNDVHPPESVKEQAVLAIQALGLDFGAVDIGYNTHTQQPTVYEVNTAPGLEGQTLPNYVEAITQLIQEA